jgi:ATP-dependent RNA helicase RhlE
LAEIENNLGKPIQRIIISKNDYENTISFTEDKTEDWKKLLQEDEQGEKLRKKKKKKK